MAGRIPERIVQQVVEHSDIVAVVGDVIRLRRSGHQLRGLCPFHGEKTPSFFVNPQQKLYFCHGCSAGGDVIRFVREIRGLSFSEAVQWLGERFGVRVELEQLTPEQARRQDADRSERRRLLDLNAAALRFYGETLARAEGAAARAYAERRGLTPETLARFGVGAAPDAWDALARALLGHGFDAEDMERLGLIMRRRSGDGWIDRFRNRLMYPVHSSAGDLVAFGGRDLGDRADTAKYMNSPESELRAVEATQNAALWKFFKKSRVVYGLWLARAGIRREGAALLVEGNLDVMTLHQAGLDHAVAPMGTALTEAQLGELRRFVDRVILCFDGDRAGREATHKAIPLALAAGFDGKVVHLPAGEDPDSFVRRCGADALRQLADEAPDLVHAFIATEQEGWDRTIQGRLAIAERVEGLLATIPDPVARELTRDRMAIWLSPDDRAAGQRAMAQVAQRAQPLAQPRSAPSAAPVQRDEPPLPALELELAEAAVWEPRFLKDIERIGAIEFLSHDGLRAALWHLTRRAEETEVVDRAAVVRWLLELPASPTRFALQQAASAPARVQDAMLQAHVEAILDSLEIQALEAHQRLLRARASGGDLGALQESQQIARRIQELKRNRQLTRALGEQAGGGRPAGPAELRQP